jgi:hypothetical protein
MSSSGERPLPNNTPSSASRSAVESIGCAISATTRAAWRATPRQPIPVVSSLAPMRGQFARCSRGEGCRANRPTRRDSRQTSISGNSSLWSAASVSALTIASASDSASISCRLEILPSLLRRAPASRRSLSSRLDRKSRELVRHLFVRQFARGFRRFNRFNLVSHPRNRSQWADAGCSIGNTTSCDWTR